VSHREALKERSSQPNTSIKQLKPQKSFSRWVEAFLYQETPLSPPNVSEKTLALGVVSSCPVVYI
jgi:hypothetical protein